MSTKGKIGFVVFMGLLCGVLTSWFAPGAISWYFTPPSEIGVSCGEATVWAIHTFQKAQLLGLVFGLILGGVLLLVVPKYFRKKA